MILHKIYVIRYQELTWKTSNVVMFVEAGYSFTLHIKENFKKTLSEFPIKFKKP